MLIKRISAKFGIDADVLDALYGLAMPFFVICLSIWYYLVLY